MLKILWIVAAAAAATSLLGFPVRRLLMRLGIIDKPNQRSSHCSPTARGGGIAILGPLFGFEIWRVGMGAEREAVWLLAMTGFLALISLWDDLRSLPALWRFLCHAGAAAGVLVALGWPPVRVELSSEWVWLLPATGGIGLMFFWLVGYTNVFNFMDGIDGIAAGQAAIAGGGMGLLAGLNSGRWDHPAVLTAFVAAGAAAGFLPHNFPKARLFMGDVGSAPLGLLWATLVIWLARDCGWPLLIPMLLLHANFLLDTGITLVRRICRGDRWYQPHREHFYQRLVRAGHGHAFVTGVEMVLQVIVLGLGVLYLHTGAVWRLVVLAAIPAIWLSFFAYCEIEFLKSLAKPAASPDAGQTGELSMTT